MTVEWLWTVEELDALPAGTVIRSRSGVIAEARGSGEWMMANSGRVQRTCDLVGAPYRWQVIYTPPVTAVVWDTTVYRGSSRPRGPRFYGNYLETEGCPDLVNFPDGTRVRVTVTVIEEAPDE